MSFTRIAPQLRVLRQAVPSSSRAFRTTTPARAAEEWPQYHPQGEYYKALLYPFDQKPELPPNSADPKVLPEDKQPVKTTSSEESAASADRPAKKKPGRKPKSSTDETSTTAETEPSANSSPPTQTPPLSDAQEKARIIFGTRLAGPEDKLAHIATKKDQSTYIAGVRVPPEPQEPDNCCMSGCVNCVWDLFREDMEEYTAKKMEAEKRLAESAGSMDSDGGGSDANWEETTPEVNVGEAKIAKDMWDDDVFANVPVGIREFMKQEKRLKERHEREGTSGG